MTAEVTRQLRSSMSTVMNQDYIRMARAKGIGEGSVTVKHALRIAAAPAISVASVQIVRLLGGAVIIEQIFALPGLGSLIVSSVLNRDLPVLQGVIPLAVVIAVVVNLVADLLQMALNPRLRVNT
jgi:peptide/nickel transport system permease protein